MKTFFRILLGVLFVFGGIMHFVNPEFYLAMMPDYLPLHQFLVDLSGVIEIILGLMAIFAWRPKLTGIALILLLIAVFPANIHVALNPELMPDADPVMLLVRLPFQALFMIWTYLTLIGGDTPKSFTKTATA
ncbi:DoxX family protein [Pseudobacteriovorax antillogorgiicola]|uniref:Uncharacterized membrane protein n=1 Tax=Pseudobacteriovorax antillogorgiicola TaxID=1513793 RepID=A0A1Y6CP43_9BACT|nr:MauE/DoxX family redox-associated membrane protein [Pseudobacteriovorax antillogorgiicola]TCS43497.1 putative membrane protein [Pseudobacteriovorax antillogorgiicola]SMF81168.1 Uncharacterized membrane protein [Pseudobacteriovorax antillogorgiicola]